jgi:hypothetical protein
MELIRGFIIFLVFRFASKLSIYLIEASLRPQKATLLAESVSHFPNFSHAPRLTAQSQDALLAMMTKLWVSRNARTIHISGPFPCQSPVNYEIEFERAS